MQILSSYNCCINIWDENLKIRFDLYVVFPEYMDNEPMTNGIAEVLEKAYQNLKNIKTIKEAENYIKNVLDEKKIEYVAVFVQKNCGYDYGY
ncbi:MAG: hypothetical protein ACLRT4_20215 [Thomasclavelia sp.]